MNIEEGAPVDEASLRFRRSRGQALVRVAGGGQCGGCRIVCVSRVHKSRHRGYRGDGSDHGTGSAGITRTQSVEVRSVVFDAFIGIALGIGLLVLLILFPVGM